MVQMHEIQRVSDQIAREFHPERIVLFGSFVDGTATVDSDVDLLVVMPFHGHSARMAAAIVNRVNPEIPVEVLVRTPDQLRQRLAWNDFFLQEVMDKGTTLYAADHAGVDRQGGR
jgi:predicted nucleotidyltransferase